MVICFNGVPHIVMNYLHIKVQGSDCATNHKVFRTLHQCQCSATWHPLIKKWNCRKCWHTHKHVHSMFYETAAFLYYLFLKTLPTPPVSNQTIPTLELSYYNGPTTGWMVPQYLHGSSTETVPLISTTKVDWSRRKNTHTHTHTHIQCERAIVSRSLRSRLKSGVACLS